MKKARMIVREFAIISKGGNIGFSFCRDMRYSGGDLVPLVVILIKKPRKDEQRIYIRYTDMNEVMFKSIMTNFKQWCKRYIELSGEYDPDNDRIIEL